MYPENRCNNIDASTAYLSRSEPREAKCKHFWPEDQNRNSVYNSFQDKMRTPVCSAREFLYAADEVHSSNRNRI